MPREPLRFTVGRWFNKPRDDGGWSKAPAYREGFTYDSFAYGSDTPEHYLPDPRTGQGVQYSIICSPATGVLAIDVDYPENLAGSRTGEHVSWQDAVSTRGGHFHVLADMRGVAPEDWPAQGRTAWGDVKAAGFVPWPGSVHYSGELYAAADDWQARVVAGTPELAAALRADRDEFALQRLNEARGRAGLSTGTRLPDGAYLYSSGYTGGSWRELPDGALCHDDELKDLTWDMHVEYGLPEEEVRREWERLAGALGKPWTERDFSRHWHRVPARRAEALERDDATRLLEDFGLKLPQTPLEAAERGQREAYEEKVQSCTSGFGPPTPPQSDGPAEDDADGISWFHVYLGGGKGPRDFDAGPPTDAGNAEEALRRAWRVLRHDEEADTWHKRVAGHWVQDADAAKEALTALLPRIPEGCADPLKHPRYEHLDPEEDAAEIAALKRHAKNAERFATSATVNSIAAMMKNIARARSEPWMTVRDSRVDADPEVLWAGGIPWDLRASAYGPARSARADRNEVHAHNAGCVPDASVGTPLWDALLDAVWPPRPLADGSQDRSLQQWAVLVLSAGVTGYPRKVVPLLRGGTDRGKSTVIDAIANVLGTYFRPLNEKVLESGSSTHDTVLMELKGTRLTFLDEGIQRGKVATARLKRLVGGSSITANRMRQDPVTFRPSHTLAITLNPEEEFSFDDPAVDSRLRLLPCEGNPEQVVTVARRFDYYTSPEWLAERSGVLAKLMSAAAYMLADPHALDKDHAPAAVTMAEQAVKNTEDEVLRWFLEATEDCPDGYPSRELYLHFKDWTQATKTDRAPVTSETKWGLRMNELVPEDSPGGKRLTTPKNSILRRRRPVQGGSGGFGGFPGAFSGLSAMGFASQASSTVVDVQKMSDVERVDPPGQGNPPANYPVAVTREFSLFSEGSDSSDSSLHSTTKKTTPLLTTTHSSRNGTGETIRGSGPSETEPVVVDLAVLPDSGDLGDAPVQCLRCGTAMRRNTQVPICTRGSCAGERYNWIKAAVFAAYGGAACACCGEERFERLSLDHVNGDGYLEGRKLKGGGAGAKYTGLFSAGFPDRERYQVLCHNCNTEKGTKAACPCGGRSDKAVFPATGENRQDAPDAITPPGQKAPESVSAPKTPRNRLTEQEKLERELARKALRAQARTDERAAKIAELGGRLVTLPAVVLRDLSILEITPDQARAWLGEMTRLGIDVEHSGFPIGHPGYALRLVQLGDEHSAVVFDPADPEQAAVIREALRAAEVLHAHSALADLTPLVHAGLGDREELWAKMHDTVILCKLTDPSLTDSDEAALKPLAKALLGKDYALSWKCDELRREIFAAGGWLGDCAMDTEVSRSGWAQIPICEAFVRYAASDVFDCAAVARVLG